MASQVGKGCATCGRSYVAERTDSCAAALCRVYASGCIATMSGIPRGKPAELIEYQESVIERITTVQASQVKNAAPGSEPPADASPKKARKTQVEYMTPEEAKAAIDAFVGSVATDAALVTNADVSSAYMSAFTLEGFQTVILDSLRGGPNRDKKFKAKSVPEYDPSMMQLVFKVVDGWNKLNSDPDRLTARIARAVKQAFESLESVDERLSKGDLPADNYVGRAGSALLATFQPYDALESRVGAEVRELLERTARSKKVFDDLKARWGKDGTKVISGIVAAFVTASKSDPRVLDVANSKKVAGQTKKAKATDEKEARREEKRRSLAAARVDEFLKGEFMSTNPPGMVVTAIAASGSLQLIRAIECVSRLADVEKTIPSIGTRLRNSMIDAYLREANARLAAAITAVTPVINAEIARLGNSNSAINVDSVWPAVSEFVSRRPTPDAPALYSSLSRSQAKAVIKTLIAVYGRVNPERKNLIARVAWSGSKDDVNAAINAIIEDLLANPKLDEIIAKSDKDLEEYLADDWVFQIAEANGVPGSVFMSQVIDSATRRSDIIGKFRAAAAAEEKKAKKPRVKESEEERLRRQGEAAQKRRADREAEKLARRAAMQASVARVVAEASRWQGNPDTYLKLSEMIKASQEVATGGGAGGGALAAPEDRPSQDVINIVNAYSTVCVKAEGFAEFVKRSMVPADTYCGTMPHSLAWKAFEMSRSGSKRRSAVVERELEKLSFEHNSREFFALGLVWPAFATASSKTAFRNKRWDKPGVDDVKWLASNIIRSRYSQLADDAPAELQEIEQRLRAAAGTSEGVPPQIQRGVTDSVVKSMEIAREIKNSVGDKEALATREAGVQEMRSIVSVGQQYLADVRAGNIPDASKETAKARITAHYVKISSSDKAKFLADIFVDWRVVISAKGPQADLGLLGAKAGKAKTRYPPYLLETVLGQEARSLYAEIWDELERRTNAPEPVGAPNSPILGEDSNLMSEAEAQTVIRADSEERSQQLIDDISEKLGEEEASEEGGDEDGSEEPLPRRKLNKLSERIKGKKKKKKQPRDEYEKDDFLVSDDEADYDGVLVDEEGKIVLPEDADMLDAPGDAAFLRNNPNPAYGKTTLGFGNNPPPPAPRAALPDPIEPTPAVPKTAPAPVNILVPKRKVVGEQVAIGAVDPFGSPVAGYDVDSLATGEDLPNL